MAKVKPNSICAYRNIYEVGSQPEWIRLHDRSRNSDFVLLNAESAICIDARALRTERRD